MQIYGTVPPMQSRDDILLHRATDRRVRFLIFVDVSGASCSQGLGIVVYYGNLNQCRGSDDIAELCAGVEQDTRQHSTDSGEGGAGHSCP
jgi:hypothetical protein